VNAESTLAMLMVQKNLKEKIFFPCDKII